MSVVGASKASGPVTTSLATLWAGRGLGYAGRARSDRRMDAQLIDLLPDLALFVAIGEAENLSAASRKLWAVEKAVGVRLMERTPRRFQLTTEGDAYLARLAPTLESFAEAYGAVSEDGREPDFTRRRLEAQGY